MKLKELTMTELVAYSHAVDKLLLHYENEIIINNQDLYNERHKNREKCVGVKDLIIKEMNRRIYEVS